MKKINLLALLILIANLGFAQKSSLVLPPTLKVLSYSDNTQLPNFISISPEVNISENNFNSWVTSVFNMPSTISFKAYNTQNDKSGYTHTRYCEYFNNIPVANTMIITHSKAGRIETFNGDYILDINASATASVNESTALASALKKVNATKYKWENKEEAAMREAINQPDFTYFPKGELVVVHKTKADYSGASFRLAYKFNIYAEEPLYRSFVFVDAITNEVIAEQQIIHTADVVGTALTKYSGTQAMTSDNYGTNQYRLREAGRGLGIRTYNLNTSTTYTNTDFTNTSANWTSTGNNQAATDAHWGAEKTYDYFNQIHSRNSIDDAGLALLSYVHYDVGYVNAFWDGQVMTYGDGDASQDFTIMTGLDVCGHEITHGLTQYTANLNGGGTGEADALNEAFSDIFGNTIEVFARPSQHSWIIGEDITISHTGIRDMSNPNVWQQPDTYNGTYWDNTGEPHTNDGPCIYWYYLLCQGGSGTNDNGNAYNVTGITMAEARLIAFRALTVYFTPGTTYANARTFTIQAATDIYGACSPEVIATTNAWRAVGVGAAFVGTPPVAAFTASGTSSCSLPFTTTFTNTSTNSTAVIWYFGDGTTSTASNPSHTYSTSGTFNVKLVATGACGADSILQTSFITINTPTAPSTTNANSCTSPSSVTLAAAGSGTLNWYTASSGGSSVHTGATYTTPSISATTTYYVESSITGATGHVGPANSSFGTGANHNSTTAAYLIFDVLQPCTIQTVVVTSTVAGTRNLILWDNAGVQLQSIPVTFINGTSTVTLNMHVNAGTGYRLGGASMNLYRNSAGASYPYTLSGVINITGSSAGAAYYYYYYYWTILNDPCVSARTPAVATIGAPSVTNSTLTQSICSGATASFTPTSNVAGTTFNWTATGTANISGYSANGTGNISNTITNAGVANGTVTYVVTPVSPAPNSCTGTPVSYVVNVKALPVISVNSPAICAGQTANLTANGGTTYAWSSGATSTGTNTATASPANTASYTVTGTTNGCANVATSIVTVTALPSVSVNSPAICAGQTANLTATGATSFVWSSGANSTGTNTASASPANTTTYTVTGTTASCSASATSTVTVNSLPSISVNSPAICAGQTATLTANGGTSYTWTAGANSTGSNTANASPVITTTYTVTGTTGGCANTAVSTVTVNTIPAVSVNSPAICSGAIANLTATGATTYFWSAGVTSTGNNTGAANPATTTTYTVTGNNGICSATATSTVTVTALPNVTVNSPSICMGQTATLTGNGAATYSWSAGATSTGNNTATASPTVTNSYLLTGTTNGCTNTAIATVTVNPTPSVNVTSSTLCAGQTATLVANGANTYTWSAGATSVGGSNATASPATTTTYTVTGNALGCTNTAIATVTVHPVPAITVNSPTICSGQTALLIANGANGYFWSAGAIPVGTDSANVSPTATTTYTVTGNALGCFGTATSTVIVNPSPLVTVNSATICEGKSATLIANGAASYSWSAGAVSLGADSARVTPLSTGSYTVTGTTNGCSATAVSTVTLLPTPTTPTITQNGNVLTSSSSAGNQWYWNGNIIAGAINQTYTAIQNGLYTVIVTSSGCSSAESASTNVLTIGINETSDNNAVLLYPNPSEGMFTISFDADVTKTYVLELKNALGQLVYSQTVKELTGNFSQLIDISVYGKGVYLFSLSADKNKSVKKVIVY